MWFKRLPILTNKIAAVVPLKEVRRIAVQEFYQLHRIIIQKKVTYKKFL